ncbi:MAG: Lrp/AsnC family transcriptional regulator [Candidatus Bathyarchaeia archaeon]
MKELKAIDYKLLFELMKDSHRSDRQLAKALDVSQPTVTRRRTMLEANVIEGYTITPTFGKIGFELAAFTFSKSKLQKPGKEKDEVTKKMKDWYMKQPNVVLVLDGRGMGWDTICVSLHKNYTDYAKFIRMHNSELADSITESQSFTADLDPDVIIKPFSLKYLADLK